MMLIAIELGDLLGIHQWKRTIQRKTPCLRPWHVSSTT